MSYTYDHAYRRYLDLTAWEQQELPGEARFVLWKRKNGPILEVFPVGRGHTNGWTLTVLPTQGAISGCFNGDGAEDLKSLLAVIGQS